MLRVVPGSGGGGLHTFQVEMAASLAGDLAIALNLAAFAFITVPPGQLWLVQSHGIEW